MATITGVRVDRDDQSAVVTWTNLVNATSDVGSGVYIGDLDDVTVQAVGTNATTVAIQGSNDGTTWAALGAGMTLTIGATSTSPVTALLVKALFIRPATPSAAADTDVILAGSRRK